ncbi:hypothetical protein NE237_024073 [Protea cynaroides]|uniref:Jacalin-type lectin domain-containing protein n=1 Tax=Protea cynaroides TaxID=273540 RepID=A0A9Q0HI37_9MAGN|nr:hypothetical protein NE237_024073 [Protea cynaroides]
MEMMMVKVGPHGSSSGNTWDDKGKSMLTQIFISYGTTKVRSIQTAHMVGEKLELSEKHGANGRLFKTIDIDYPSEFLIGISGYTGSVSGVNNPALQLQIVAVAICTPKSSPVKLLLTQRPAAVNINSLWNPKRGWR